jgi:hypothetical protein
MNIMNIRRRSYHLTLTSAADIAQAGISFAQALDHSRSGGAADSSRAAPAPRTGSMSRHLPITSGNTQVVCR